MSSPPDLTYFQVDSTSRFSSCGNVLVAGTSALSLVTAAFLLRML